MDAAGWTPRVPLVAAERRVDFPGINNHIRTRRAAVERAATPAAKRLAFIVSEHHLPTARAEADLEEALYVALTRTIDFGYSSVRRELAGPRPAIRGALQFPGIGERGRTVLQGLPGVHNLVRSRARIVAHNVADAARSAAHKAEIAPGSTAVTVQSATAAQVRRTLHNGVLQVVSEALNLGRATAAQEILQERSESVAAMTVLAAADGTVPEYAMRSEQLDENTCGECDQVHGEIVQVGSDEYYDLMPPSYCEGEGRCRGLYIYGEGSEFASEAPSGPEQPSADRFEWKSGGDTLFRGVSGPDAAAASRSGELGTGDFGRGIYLTRSAQQGIGYARNGGIVMRALLRPGAKVATEADLPRGIAQREIAAWTLEHGYDAYTTGINYVIVVNPKALIWDPVDHAPAYVLDQLYPER